QSGHELGAAANVSRLTLAGAVLGNLLPVTIGNIIGGAGLVGLSYWLIYLRPRRLRGAEAPPALARTDW
ncbi:MAG: hypothetical protein QME94_06665, partial [Anaerolineae bacterium]|nr:hypothetical protein [Anaerolineae bacterium]